MSERTLNRIPLEKLMDLKVDYAFKLLFGNEEHKDITMNLLNALLKRPSSNQLKDFHLTTSEITVESEEDELSRIDYQVVTQANDRMHVQIHFSNHFDSIKRSIFYYSQLFTAQLSTGRTYKELRPILIVHLLNFDLLDQPESFHTTYHIYDDLEKLKLTDLFELHFVEFPKLLRSWKTREIDPYTNISARWLLFLSIVDDRKNKIFEDIYRELELLAMKDSHLLDAFRIWQDFSLNETIYQAYEERLKQILEAESALIDLTNREEEAFKKGVMEGRKKEKIELAKKMITNQHELEYIAFMTGLTLLEVKELSQNIHRF